MGMESISDVQSEKHYQHAEIEELQVLLREATLSESRLSVIRTL